MLSAAFIVWLAQADEGSGGKFQTYVPSSSLQATLMAQTKTLNVCAETRGRLLEAEHLMQKQSTELDAVEKKLKSQSQLEFALWEEKRQTDELRKKLEGRDEAHGKQIATLQSALSTKQSTGVGTLEELKRFIAANCNTSNSARLKELQSQLAQAHTRMVRNIKLYDYPAHNSLVSS